MIKQIQSIALDLFVYKNSVKWKKLHLDFTTTILRKQK